MPELAKYSDRGELTTTTAEGEGDVRALVASLAQHLHSAAVKQADDVICEVDFSSDDMGSRGRLRFRSYRRRPTAA